MYACGLSPFNSHLNLGADHPTIQLLFVREQLNRPHRAMAQPDEYEMDRQQLDVRPPTRSSAATDITPQIEQDEEVEQVQVRVRNLEVGRTLRRGLEARQVSTTTRLVRGAN